MNYLTVEKERYVVPKFVEMRKIITESGARIKSTTDSVGHTWFGVMLGNLVASRIWRQPIGMGFWTKRFDGVDPQQSERVLQAMLRMGYLEDITRGRRGKDADGNVQGVKALIRPSFEVMNLVEWGETHLSCRGCNRPQEASPMVKQLRSRRITAIRVLGKKQKQMRSFLGIIHNTFTARRMSRRIAGLSGDTARISSLVAGSIQTISTFPRKTERKSLSKVRRPKN